jgi:hypothetical protein
MSTEQEDTNFLLVKASELSSRTDTGAELDGTQIITVAPYDQTQRTLISPHTVVISTRPTV